MARGELSYSKARALTLVATRATEDVLLRIARLGTAELSGGERNTLVVHVKGDLIPQLSDIGAPRSHRDSRCAAIRVSD